MKPSIGILTFLAVFLLSIGSLLADEATDYVNRGIVKGQKGDFAGALIDFNSAIELNPAYALAYNERGLARGGLATKADMDSALASTLADYNKAIELKPDFAAAYYNRGNVFQAEGNWNAAQADFLKVVELKPDMALLAQAYMHLGGLKQREGKDSNAAYLFSMAYTCRGISEARHGDTNNALVDFTKAIGLNPLLDSAYYNRGKVKQSKSDFSGALSDFDKAIQLNPNFSDFYNDRGNVKLAQNDWDGAVADYNKSIELDPRNAKAFMNRGIVKANRGDISGSKIDFRKAIELNPQFRERIQADGYSVE